MELLENLPTRKKKINIKKEVTKYLRNWYWIVLSMLVFYIAAKVYLRYTERQYLSKTTLQFAESKNKSNTTLGDLETLGTGLKGNSELQSETTAILSKPILTKVVENLNLNFSFYGLGAIKEPELYKSSPVSPRSLEITDLAFYGTSYKITAAGNRQYELSEGPLLKGKHRFTFGQVAELPFGKMILDLREGAKSFPTMKMNIRSTKAVVSGLEGAVSVTLPENKGLLMDLALTGTVPAKSEDILNEITHQYNIEDVKDRNLESQNTQDFINDRLEIISGDLSGIESQKEGFKKQNQITDIDAQANMALNNSNDNVKQLVQFTTQLDLVNSIYSASATEKLLPSNMGLSSVTEGYIARYNDMLITRNNTLKQATSQNPSVIRLNKDISEMRDLIRQNLQETKVSLQTQIAQVQGQLDASRNIISNYPTQEKIFRGIERQQNLKEQLYLYLLQKREENAITLAVTTPKAKVLNPAYTIGAVKPNYGQITMGALAAGFLLPLLLLYAKFALDTKVHTKDQIQSHIPGASVIAEIPAQEEDQVLVAANDFSVFAESFRILTSNLKFILKAENEDQSNKGVILVTSSIKGEGKTTIAMNTALTLAGASKVLIIGADIRNPQLQRFAKEHKKGLTDYLVAPTRSTADYIVPSGIAENLDIFFSGAIAPNPNDLLDMQKFDDMIDGLREVYDYIILDSAPIMLVSDTMHLMENADVILYIVKSDYTENEMLDFAEEFQHTNDLHNMTFVLNNVQPENTRYGNKYGYGYYSYTESKNKKKGLKKFF